MNFTFLEGWEWTKDELHVCSHCHTKTETVTLFCPACGERKLNECRRWRFLDESGRMDHGFERDPNVNADAFILPIDFRFCPVCGGESEESHYMNELARSGFIYAPPFPIVAYQDHFSKKAVEYREKEKYV